MAKVLGESGRYVSDAAEREWRRMVLLACSAVGLVGLIEGIVLSSWLSSVALPPWVKGTVLIAFLPVLLVFWKWFNRRMSSIEKRRNAYRRGANGEDQVARVLASFPDDFYILHDLATPFGNVDHVVTGPTGVFFLDTKSWRGIVTGDGNGELRVNGESTERPQVRPFVARILAIRDKVRTLAPGLDPFYQAVFVFTSARVEAKWGTTGSVHCIRDEQLHDYIVEKDFGKRLPPEKVQPLAQAFLALAHMDRDFTEHAAQGNGAGSRSVVSAAGAS